MPVSGSSCIRQKSRATLDYKAGGSLGRGVAFVIEDRPTLARRARRLPSSFVWLPLSAFDKRETAALVNFLISGFGANLPLHSHLDCGRIESFRSRNLRHRSLSGIRARVLTALSSGSCEDGSPKHRKKEHVMKN
jgi:hypothetical protein